MGTQGNLTTLHPVPCLPLTLVQSLVLLGTVSWVKLETLVLQRILDQLLFWDAPVKQSTYKSNKLDPDFCTLFGFSGKPEGAASCKKTLTGRTITCLPGYVILPLNTTSITLEGSADFSGCLGMEKKSHFLDF